MAAEKDPLDFLETKDLLRFFRRNKNEMSCMEKPQIFLRQLRDHDLISEDRYKTVTRLKRKDQIKDAIYDIFDQIGREKSDCILDFWRCIFRESIKKLYPTLQELYNNLLKELVQRVEKEDTVKKNMEKRRRTVSIDDEEQPGPSSQTPVHQKKSRKTTFSSSSKKGERAGVRPNTSEFEEPVTCGELTGKLNKDKLTKGKSCILFHKRWFTPSEFELCAGRGSSKNWKLSIRCNGKTLKECMKKWKINPPAFRGGAKKNTRRKKPLAKKPQRQNTKHKAIKVAIPVKI
ncbi:nuclear autoantigen Sp-100-like [Anabas testudineus]|uniref:Uncharacterized protein n=1 Tax=Anabas testudineus TaxID=64144 RepID=A0AAQ6IDB3_ANATE|nr:nuclear autoantigen Sp-100-like [Anabas testudineus]